MHDFRDSLAKSHAAEDLPLWREVYEKAFPFFQEMLNHRMDGEHQRAGVDRSIILYNSKQILIDEKVRFKNEKTGKVYTDILLEYLSDVQRKQPGWVCKPLRCDYIAYAIAPIGKCYLMPVPALQTAWAKYGSKWIEDFPICDAHNTTWTTRSVAVPVAALFPALGEMLRVNFTPTNGVATEFPQSPMQHTAEELNDPDIARWLDR